MKEQQKKHISCFKNGTWVLWCMAIPCLILIFLFCYVPLFGWSYAFFDYRPGVSIFESAFVGFKYFEKILSGSDLALALRNTFAFSGLGLLCAPIPIIFAIMLSEFKSKPFQKAIQTVTTFPNFISWITIYAICMIVFSVDDGFFNKILLNLGFIQEPFNFLANKDIVWLLQTALGIWKGTGFGAIVYFAAIASIDQEIYDAAAVDGANRFQRIWHIKVPGIMPTFIVLFLLSIASILNSSFDQLFVFYNPAIHSTITTIDLYVYKIGVEQANYSFATAVGISKTLVSVVLLVIANLVAKKVRGTSIL